MADTEYVFYRRVSPKQWRDDDSNTPVETLFRLRTNAGLNEKGLSVFDARLATPDAVLEHLLSLWRRGNNSSKLAECGGTTKGLRELGWGVVAFQLSDEWLAESDFTLSTPDIYGHLEILGTRESFATFAPAFVDMCRRVAESEY